MEQTQQINGLAINYTESGEGWPVILLHGWASDLRAFTGVQQNLVAKFRVFAIDLPGFGKSQEPDEAWGVEEYTQLIEEFCRIKQICNPVLAGHSFGGRVSIMYASRNPVLKLVLIDSAGIKPARSLSYYLKVYGYKFVRNILPYITGPTKAAGIIERYRNRSGSADYKNASPMLRQVLIKSVNLDLRQFMPSIKAPTLLVWGENDTAAPVSDARIMEKLIPNAGLVVLKNAGHFSFVEKQNEFLLILDNFLYPDRNKKAALLS